MPHQPKTGTQGNPKWVEGALNLAERELEAKLASAYAASAEQDTTMAQEARAADNDGLSHDAW